MENHPEGTPGGGMFDYYCIWSYFSEEEKECLVNTSA